MPVAVTMYGLRPVLMGAMGMTLCKFGSGCAWMVALEKTCGAQYFSMWTKTAWGRSGRPQHPSAPVQCVCCRLPLPYWSDLRQSTRCS